MNNPFLSDRNIFSKVVNPLKKKSETEKKDDKPIAPPAKPMQNYRESKVQTYNNYKIDKPMDVSPVNKNSFGPPQTQKMSFGPEQERKATFDKKYFNSSQQYESSESEIETQPIYNYTKTESNKFAQNNSNTFSEKYRTAQNRQNEVLSPPQEYKFQEFRKRNNLNEVSPINPQPQRMGESQFLNIDALGDDLNRFLAESKNQEELCKILGIERTAKKEENFDKMLMMSKPQHESKPMIGSKTQYEEKPMINSKPLFEGKPYGEANAKGNQTSPSELPRVPAIFSKERKVQIAKTDQYVPYKPPQQLEKSSNDYIPTFNYAGLDQQNSTTSKQEEEIGRMKVATSSNKPKVSFQGSKASKNSDAIDNLEVFNYSKVAGSKDNDSLQQIIAKQMMELSINGKYRTFLSASEKVVTFKYKMEVL